MENIRTLLNLIETEAAKRGIDPGSLCRSATDNPRLYKRLLLRARQTDHDAKRIAHWITANPTSSPNTKRAQAAE